MWWAATADGALMLTVPDVLSSVMNGHRDDAPLPDRLCARCADHLDVTGVGMALMTEAGHEGVVGVTDGTARVMEDLQFTLGEGPCIDSSRDGRPVLQPDLLRTAPARWPAFGPAVLEAGIAAIFAFPLQLGGIRLGVLDLYRDSAGNLSDGEFRNALVYADAAAILLLHLQGLMEPGDGLHPQLAEPIGNRMEIHQATGMISVQVAVGLAEALLLLRAHSFAAERSIFDVATDVVHRRLRFGPEQDHNG